MKTTAERLREIMTERNLKQADIIELAKPLMDKYGVKLTRPDMSQYCAGKVNPTQGKLFLLAAALDVDEAWLMGYDVEQKRKPRYRDLENDNILLRIAKQHGDQELVDEYYHRSFDRTMTEEERDIIHAYRQADERTQTMILFMLKLKGIDDANR